MSNLQKAIKYLLFATAFLPLAISDKFIYPFVSPRTGFFYFLVELAFVLFLVAYAQGHIKKQEKGKNFLILAFGAFVLANIISAFFGASLQNSIFGTIERGWGILTLAHVLLFFFLVRVFFQKKDWLSYFKIIVWVSVLVSVIGILQRFGATLGVGIFLAGEGRILTTLGNPIYVAIYLLFGIFFALYIPLQDKKETEKFNFIYLIPVCVNLFAFLLADTRGTYLGFLGGLFTAGFLYIFLGEKRKLKISIASIMAALILLALIAFSFPGNTIVQNTPILNRVSTISFSGASITTRFIGWTAAWHGFLDNPILGTGPENFNIVFNKYVTPEFYIYESSSPYFDRAHNNYLDILASVGIVGFLTYLGFIFFIFYFIHKCYKAGKFGIYELMLFLGIFTAYLIHQVFVFDDLNSLVLVVLFAAFLEFSARDKNIFSFEQVAISKDALQKTAAFVLVLAVLLIGYQYNLKVVKASKFANDAYLEKMTFEKSGNLENFKQAIRYYSDAINLNTIKKKGIVFVYVDFLNDATGKYDLILKDKGAEDAFRASLDEVKKELEEELKSNNKDALTYVKYSSLNNAYFIAYGDKKYIDESVALLQKAVSLSEGRPQYYHLLSEAYFIANDPEKSIEAAKKAMEMEPRYNKSYFVLSRAHLLAGDLNKSLEYMKIADEKSYAPNQNTLKLLAKSLLDKKRTKDALDVYAIYLKNYAKDAQVLSQVTVLYLEIGDYDKAKNAAQKASEINPNLKQATDYIISEIDKGNAKSLLSQLK